MPTIDGGHVFLTVFAPVRLGTTARADGMLVSHENALREALASLPTARQSAACDASPCESPFSRNTRNHFVRMAVISNAAFNGRDHSDAILTALPSGADPAIARSSDTLASPYLLWTADVDLGDNPVAAQATYLETLWTTMRAELSDIFGHCVGFDKVTDAGSFSAWIGQCQIETTMPFNDYWAHPSTAKPPGLLAKIGALLFGTVFPTAPGGDLPTVLKALYLQRQFTPFATTNQGVGDDELHRNFGVFIAVCNPAGSGPTQTPGELG